MKLPSEVVEYKQMNESIKMLDVVALLEDQPDRGLVSGQVGTVVEIHQPGIFEVEFCDKEGKAYAIQAFRTNQLMPLHYSPMAV